MFLSLPFPPKTLLPEMVLLLASFLLLTGQGKGETHVVSMHRCSTFLGGIVRFSKVVDIVLRQPIYFENNFVSLSFFVIFNIRFRDNSQEKEKEGKRDIKIF